MRKHPAITTISQFIVSKVNGPVVGNKNRQEVPKSHIDDAMPQGTVQRPNDIDVTGNVLGWKMTFKATGIA